MRPQWIVRPPPAPDTPRVVRDTRALAEAIDPAATERGTAAASGPAVVAALAPAYRPRRPTETVLYGIVREHLETFLAHARESYSVPLPRYVEDEFRGFLRCGVFAHGFVRAHCEACGHDLLVAFSCKSRGICPSCAGRRMANTAAHLVDRVLPAVPVRQWVLSLPFELRGLAAFRARVLSAMARIFVDCVFARYRARARIEGHEGALQCGAVTFVQRFGSSLNLNVHFHVVVLDGVYLCDARGRVRFEPLAPPSPQEIERVTEHVQKRARSWLERQLGKAPPGDESQVDDPPQTSLDACAAIAMRRGEIRALRDEPTAADDADPVVAPPRQPGAAVERAGFNVEASVAIPADDDLGRERLCRYGARPPFALDRLCKLAAGRVAYRIKKLRRGRAKQRVMTPLELLARLAALVPPPRYPLVRYHGVLAPKSPWRKSVVPKPRATAPCPRSSAERCAPSDDPKTRRHDKPPSNPRTSSPRSRSEDASAPPTALPGQAPDRVPASRPPLWGGPESRLHRPATSPDAVEFVSPNVLSVQHWGRLLDGQLYAHSTRVDWARLLRRTFDVDVLQCARCKGPLRVVGEVTHPDVVRFILDRLGLPTEAPTPARARDPTELVGHDDSP